MSKVVFFDIDGTLVSKQNHVPESTKRAIKELKKRDILPVIATGRAPLLLQEVKEKLEIDSFISMNGQFVVLNGKPIFANPLSKEVVTRLTDEAAQRNNGVMLCGSQDVYTNSFISLAKRSSVLSLLKGLTKFIPGKIQIKLLRRAMKKPPEPEEYAGKDIYQVILEANPGEEAHFEEAFPELAFTRSNDFSLDVISQGVSKAVGIQKFIEAIGVKREDTYAFGDSLNDVEMMQYVGTGVAMGNGLPEVKEASDMITDEVSEDGIEKGLKKLGLI